MRRKLILWAIATFHIIMPLTTTVKIIFHEFGPQKQEIIINLRAASLHEVSGNWTNVNYSNAWNDF